MYRFCKTFLISNTIKVIMFKLGLIKERSYIYIYAWTFESMWPDLDSWPCHLLCVMFIIVSSWLTLCQLATAYTHSGFLCLRFCILEDLVLLHCHEEQTVLLLGAGELFQNYSLYISGWLQHHQEKKEEETTHQKWMKLIHHQSVAEASQEPVMWQGTLMFFLRAASFVVLLQSCVF